MTKPVKGSASAETSGDCRPLPGSDACHDGLGQNTLSPPPPPPYKPFCAGGSWTTPPLSRKASVSPHAVVIVDPGWLTSFRIEVPPMPVACGAIEGTPGAPIGVPRPLSPPSPVEKLTVMPL